MVIKKSKGLAFRKAHEVVGKIVAHADKQKKQIFELDLRELRKYSKLIEKDALSLIKPEEIINKDSIGGTSSKQVLKQINNAKRELNLRR